MAVSATNCAQPAAALRDLADFGGPGEVERRAVAVVALAPALRISRRKAGRILFGTIGRPFLDLKRGKALRSRLYRRRFLRPNTLWKALDEIYNFHILLVT